jgi:Fe-S cluster biogenesis protein NfuA
MSTGTGPLSSEVAAALHRLDDLVRMFEEHPDPSVQEAAIEMLRAVDVVHRGGVQRLAALLDARALLEEASADPHVALLLGLYEPQDADDEWSRAEAAIAGVRPYVESHGGRLELVAAEDGVVNIRLLGACASCSGSTATLIGLVEEALRAELPDFVRMDVDAAAPRDPAPVLIPLSSLVRRGPGDQPQGDCGSGGGCGPPDRGCATCG